MTESDRTGLTPEQELAIARLLEGATDAEAAEAAGVTRQTVNTWRNRNPVFMAELNARRRALWDAHQDRLRGLIGRALDVLAEDLADDCQMFESRRIRQAAAVQILRAAAGLKPDGPVNAGEIEAQQRTQEMLISAFGGSR